MMIGHSVCSALFRKQKKQRKKYGHLPVKEAECLPWERLCVDLIGPYNIKSKIKYLTMIGYRKVIILKLLNEK